MPPPCSALFVFIQPLRRNSGFADAARGLSIRHAVRAARHRSGRLLFALNEPGMLAVKTADERYDLWRLNRM
ncbi:hypothetical protein [Burkholderia perseverans]|uniref:hypothetical protein n=1 Tax=Burkholderia perseverans TaxID=2615214 RepID=UPI001FF025AE|nr:hypothetical protein [Burkholderia perseverans]